MGRPELEKEYQERLLADPEQTTVDWAWLWFLKALHTFDGTPAIYELCQKDPKDRALMNSWSFVHGKLSERGLYNALIAEAGEPYAASLLGAEITGSDLREDERYQELMREMALQAVKALRPLVGLTQGPDACLAIALPTATLWLQFVDSTHALARLPRVRELKETMHLDHLLEKEIRESDDFTAYVLTDKEREDLKRDLEISSRSR
jgi:hypothetical protein